MAQKNQQFEYDVVILGSGAAGLSLAVRLARQNLSIAIITKARLQEGCTVYAQGGISAVLGAGDSIESHIQDTLVAGVGLCDVNIVERVATEGKLQIDWLLKQGMPFSEETTPSGQKTLHLTREGGHSHRRVAHAADATGRELETTLENQVRQLPQIQLFEHHIAIDLITSAKIGLSGNRCLGVYVLNKHTQKVEVFKNKFLVLATGGAGKVYLYTSNPDVASGDGIAMGYRAGCRVANMEFIQFHPTCLYHPKAKSFLLTEALRGEGGLLLLPDGSRFMPKFDSRAELAPRDIVARAIDHEMKRLGSDCVYLDIQHKPAEFIKSHFPNIYQKCLDFGYDMTKEPIPVVPAAHYTCGGILTDHQGRTDIENCYAIGEVACTGLHGANRMASNSLLECLTFAKFAAEHILQQKPHCSWANHLPKWDESRVTNSDEEILVSHSWDELRRFMWDYVGIVRTTKRLERAKRRIELLTHEIAEYYGNFRISNDLIELRNLVVVADLIVRCALNRKESRGLHYTLDYPETDHHHPPQNTVLVPPSFQGSCLDNT